MLCIPWCVLASHLLSKKLSVIFLSFPLAQISRFPRQWKKSPMAIQLRAAQKFSQVPQFRASHRASDSHDCNGEKSSLLLFCCKAYETWIIWKWIQSIWYIKKELRVFYNILGGGVTNAEDNTNVLVSTWILLHKQHIIMFAKAMPTC